MRYISSIIIITFLLLSACKKTDNSGDTPYKASPYWILAGDNPNMPTGGTLSTQYSDAPEGSEIKALVDNNPDSKYITNHSSVDIIWSGTSNVILSSYSLISACDLPEYDPKSWILYGSEDSKNWKNLDEQNDQVFASRSEKRSYNLDNNKAYRYYKLSIIENNSGDLVQIAEWSLSVSTVLINIDDLMKSATGRTFSESNPLGLNHKSDKDATAEDISWLMNSAKEPDTFDGHSWKSVSVTNLYPNGDPSPSDVNQHAIGDCSALAVLSALAYSFPDFIKSIVTDNRNNTYTVKLFDPDGDEVLVSVSNSFIVGGAGKLGAVSGKNDVVTWATVIEKAVMKWKQVYQGSSNMGGIATEYFAPILTGNGESFAFSSNVLDANDLKRAVDGCLQNRMIVIGGFSRSDVIIDGKYKSVSGHAYNFLPASSSDYLFTMRNPWGAAPSVSGGNDGTMDGLLFIEDDGVVPPIIDLRICNAGAALQCAKKGTLEIYTPPKFQPSPVRLSYSLGQY